MKGIFRINGWIALIEAAFLTVSLFAQEVDSRGFMPESLVHGVLADNLASTEPHDINRLSRHLIHLCKQYDFDPAFVLSLIRVESSFRPMAISSMGAVGLMQVMPDTADYVSRKFGLHLWDPAKGRVKALMNPFTNITVGIAYLADLRERYKGLPPYYLLAAYNVGPARLDELRSRKDFKPVKTKEYFEAIKKGASEFKFYSLFERG